jgi:hypothetical protein
MNDRNETGGGLPAHTSEERWWEQVPVIVPGQEIFTKDQVRLLLGGISDSTYYVISPRNPNDGKRRNYPVLKFSRLTPGGLVYHTREQVEEYKAQLSGKPFALKQVG